MGTACRESGHPDALQREPYAMSLIQSVTVVTQRQMKLMVRDVAMTRGRWSQVRTLFPSHLVFRTLFGLLPIG